MEHIVSRADLARSESSPSASPELDVLEKFKDLGQFEFVAADAQAPGDVYEQGEGEEDGLDFQLFAAAPKSGGDTTTEARRIRLRSPSMDPDKIGFIRPHRSQSYYFTNPLKANDKRNLDAAAITGAQVLAHATSPWPGSAYSWKVLHLPPSGLSKNIRPTIEQSAFFTRLTAGEQSKKRTRPGKKYRIKLRKKAAALEAKKDAKRVAEEAKEAAEREKRTRRNREKKVKRKAKEKAKKVEGGGEGVDVEDWEDGSVE